MRFSLEYAADQLDRPLIRMLIKLLKSKIHQATVTFTDVNYHGSITIDPVLMEACGMLPNEAVLIADCDNGNRFETYIILGERGSGIIGINGAAARLSKVGHRVIIMCFAQMTPEESTNHVARVVIATKENRPGELIQLPSKIG